MRMPYHESVGGMWRSHAAAPLRASDIALYHYIARKTHANGWRMPVFVANGLMCPMLFEKSTLETARKPIMKKRWLGCESAFKLLRRLITNPYHPHQVRAG